MLYCVRETWGWDFPQKFKAACHRVVREFKETGEVSDDAVHELCSLGNYEKIDVYKNVWGKVTISDWAIIYTEGEDGLIDQF